MTKKELTEHKWVPGEIAYVVGYKHYKCFKIPMRVLRVQITEVTDCWLFVRGLNKEYRKYLDVCGYCLTLNRHMGYHHTDLFLTKKDAQNRLEEKKQEFKEKHRKRFCDLLRQDLRALDSEKAKVCNLFQLNILYEQ